MQVSRRDFLRASAAVAAALGVRIPSDARQALALEDENGGVPVVWLEAQSCTGCSISLLNSVYYETIESLLLEHLDLNFHPALMAASGSLAVSAAERAYRHGGYVLVVEGSIPTAADGEYCYLWSGLTAVDGVDRFARRAAHIIAAGSCAAFGGMVAAEPNPTGAQGLDDEYYGKRVIKIPGCPTHPDWIVGTIAHLMEHGTAPDLDGYGRPLEFFSKKIHDVCPRLELEEVTSLGQMGCLRQLGCKGPRVRADCPDRGWNSAGPGEKGVNWCIGAGAPCFGCTEPTFPDRMSPFYVIPQPED